MRLLPSLLRSVVLPIVVSAAVALAGCAAALPLQGARLRILGAALAAAVALGCAAVGALAARLARPVEAALASGGDGEAGAEAARALPSRLAGAVLAAEVAPIAAVLWSVPGELAGVAAVVAASSALLAAMLAHASVSVVVAGAIERLELRRTAQGLKTLVVDVQVATEGVSEGAREAGALGDRVRTGVASQQGGVAAVQRAFEAMGGSVVHVSRGAGALSEYVAETTHAVSELGAAYEAVRAKQAELERAMDSALHDVENLGAAGRDAEATLGDLDALAEQAGSSLAGVKASVAGLERAAEESEATAASVADLAVGAGGVVEETAHGIEALRAAVADAHRRISVLGRRSDDIDQVVDFISEVAGRTNLLSLNASIIAAQAGEHGKAFAVVADQIRELAAQIARSTKSIGDIIHAVREDVEATAALIDRGDALAAEGVQLARNSLEALSRIQRSTAHGRETAAAIRAAVDAHGASARDIVQLVASVADGSRSVAQAVQLVGRSVAGVRAVARTAKTLTDGLARAVEEQSGASKRQYESLGRIERLIGDLTRAVETHDAAALRVRDALQRLAQQAGSSDDAVAGLAGASDQLGARAKALAERVARLKV